MGGVLEGLDWRRQNKEIKPLFRQAKKLIFASPVQHFIEGTVSHYVPEDERLITWAGVLLTYLG